MGKNKRLKGFKAGSKGDSDESAPHVTPKRTDAHIEAPAGTFVDVPQGMIAVPGAVVDKHGTLRREETGELAIWHHRCKFDGHGPCERYTSGPSNFVTEDEVVYIAGAPWCPDCVKKMQEDTERKKLHDMFRGNTESN